jgi:hypothetical protein
MRESRARETKTSVSRSGRWESALWMMVGVNALMMALALLIRRQENPVAVAR